MHISTSPRTRPTRSLVPLAFVVLGALLVAGCTLLESPDDHFLAVDAAGDMSTASELCSTYCNGFLDVCGSNAANTYTDREDCLTQCAAMDDGAPTDYSRDSVQCRINHLGASETTPDVHCPHASAEGGGQCVGSDFSDCELYCTDLSERCPGIFEAQADPPLGASAGCIKMCQNAIIDTGSTEDEYVGNTLACHRTYLRLVEDPSGLFCQAAQPTDAVACNGEEENNACEAYCLLARERCGAEFADEFGTDEACSTTCDGLLPGEVMCLIDEIAAAACGRAFPLDASECTGS